LKLALGAPQGEQQLHMVVRQRSLLHICESSLELGSKMLLHLRTERLRRSVLFFRNFLAHHIDNFHKPAGGAALSPAVVNEVFPKLVKRA
jgi:hypothetical protein